MAEESGSIHLVIASFSLPCSVLSTESGVNRTREARKFLSASQGCVLSRVELLKTTLMIQTSHMLSLLGCEIKQDDAIPKSAFPQFKFTLRT